MCDGSYQLRPPLQHLLLFPESRFSVISTYQYILIQSWTISASFYFHDVVYAHACRCVVCVSANMCMYVCMYVIECVRVGVLENACVRAFGCEHVRVSMMMCVHVYVCLCVCLRVIGRVVALPTGLHESSSIHVNMALFITGCVGPCVRHALPASSSPYCMLADRVSERRRGHCGVKQRRCRDVGCKRVVIW